MDKPFFGLTIFVLRLLLSCRVCRQAPPEVQQQFAPVKSVVHGLFNLKLLSLAAAHAALYGFEKRRHELTDS